MDYAISLTAHTRLGTEALPTYTTRAIGRNETALMAYLAGNVAQWASDAIYRDTSIAPILVTSNWTTPYDEETYAPTVAGTHRIILDVIGHNRLGQLAVTLVVEASGPRCGACRSDRNVNACDGLGHLCETCAMECGCYLCASALGAGWDEGLEGEALDAEVARRERAAGWDPTP